MNKVKKEVFCNTCGNKFIPIAGKAKYVCPSCQLKNRQANQKRSILILMVERCRK